MLVCFFCLLYKLTTTFCVSFQSHHSVKMCFSAFMRYPGGFHLALCPILSPLESGVWLHLSTTTCYLSQCGTHTHTHLNVVREACDICSLSGRLHMSSTSFTSLLSISAGGGGAIWQGDKKRGMKWVLFFLLPVCTCWCSGSVTGRSAAWWTQSSHPRHQSNPQRKTFSLPDLDLQCGSFWQHRSLLTPAVLTHWARCTESRLQGGWKIWGCCEIISHSMCTLKNSCTVQWPWCLRW